MKLVIKIKNIYGFIYYLPCDQQHERTIDFKSISELNAIKNYKRWIKKEKLISGKYLGELIEYNRGDINK